MGMDAFLGEIPNCWSSIDMASKRDGASTKMRTEMFPQRIRRDEPRLFWSKLLRRFTRSQQKFHVGNLLLANPQIPRKRYGERYGERYAWVVHEESPMNVQFHGSRRWTKINCRWWDFFNFSPVGWCELYAGPIVLCFFSQRKTGAAPYEKPNSCWSNRVFPRKNFMDDVWFFPEGFLRQNLKTGVSENDYIYIYSSRHVQNLADNMLIKHKHHELYRQNKCDLAYFPEQNMTKPPNQTRISTSFHAARAARLISPMIAPPRKRPTVWGHASAVQVVCVFAHFREDENHPQTGLSSNVASPKLAGWENHRKIPSMDDN